MNLEIYRLLHVFGQKSIDVFEWQRADVKKTRLKNDPKWSDLAITRSPLLFSGWNLAHAVIKTDYLVSQTPFFPSIGFLLQMSPIFDFGSGNNLRLVRGGSSMLNDVTLSSSTGRLGQGLSVLFAQSLGYSFVGHLASAPMLRNHLGSSSSLKIADFLFETSVGSKMILEAKGSFKQAENDPSRIKRVLKKALDDQVDPWMSRLKPAVNKGYATYSCFRESGNPYPSALIFVDPPEHEDPSPIELPPAWVRRVNYGPWLEAMGLSGVAEKLNSGETRSRRKIRLPVVRIREQEFALHRQRYPFETLPQVVLGIDVKALSAISAAIGGEQEQLLDYKGIEESIDHERDIASDSVFPDGTYLGLIENVDEYIGHQTFLL